MISLSKKVFCFHLNTGSDISQPSICCLSVCLSDFHVTHGKHCRLSLSQAPRAQQGNFSQWSESHVASVSRFVFLSFWRMTIHTVCVNGSSKKWWWSFLGGLQCPRGCWGDDALLQAAPEVYSLAGWMLQPQLLAVGCCCAPALTRQLNRRVQLNLRSQPAATRMQKQTDCLNFKSPRRQRCWCTCFCFTSLKWTSMAESKQALFFVLFCFFPSEAH